MVRILSIDYGMARIGMALSDELKMIASPLPTLQAEKKLESTVCRVASELAVLTKTYKIEEIVLGFPLKMDGKVGLMADEVSLFADLLREHTSIPVRLWDERLTSVMADRSMREGRMNRKKRAGSVDRVAAVLILQSYLDSLHFSTQ